MFEELAEIALGPWGIAILIAIGASRTDEGRKALRKTAKAAIRGGMYLAEKGKELAADVKSGATEVVAEAEAEHREKDSAR
jgi:hypothetical protein